MTDHPPELECVAHVEALGLLLLLLRNVRAVCALAEQDVEYLPAAGATARTAFEAAATAVWLVRPEDDRERDTRWASRLRAEREDHVKIIRDLTALGCEAYAQYCRYREMVLGLLLDGAVEDGVLTEVQRCPSVSDLLKSVCIGELYGIYVCLCQHVHPTHQATTRYIDEPFTDPIAIGDRAEAEDWLLPMGACYLSMRLASNAVEERCGLSLGEYVTDEISAIPIPLLQMMSRELGGGAGLRLI